ncbi:hypothetical protein AB0L68_36390 [Streptomyces sp. NPDC052164]|uniref:hypothetical protein n=1 Tax=Streptomyces sp. NPDC052164 TaxID=3155529 RepID=UPI00343B28B3
MPDWLPGLRWLSAALGTARRATSPAPGRDTETRLYVACHRPSCGHLEWPHDVTGEGLVCTHCRKLNAPAS